MTDLSNKPISYTGSHPLELAYRALSARAEAAEADNRRLTARVAELESQLAAQQWRPVTEEWPPYGVQHLGRAMLDSPTMLVTRVLFESDMVWLWQDNDDLLLYGNDIRYCAAIPTATATEDKV